MSSMTPLMTCSTTTKNLYFMFGGRKPVPYDHRWLFNNKKNKVIIRDVANLQKHTTQLFKRLK